MTNAQVGYITGSTMAERLKSTDLKGRRKKCIVINQSREQK